MEIGYGRVSTAEQSLAAQTSALEQARCERIFTDHGVSGALASRPGLDEMLGMLRAGDRVTVYKTDRLGRSLKHTITLLDELRERGVAFRSLTEPIDTATPMGVAMLQIIQVFAELERSVGHERTLAGLAASRAAGRVGGRPRALSAAMVQVARTMAAGGAGATTIAAELGVSRATVYRALTLST